MKDFFQGNVPYYFVSMAVHSVLMVIIGLGTVFIPNYLTDPRPPTFESPAVAPPAPQLSRFEVGDTPMDPSELNLETLTFVEPPGQTAQDNDDSDVFTPSGGGRPTTEKGPQLGGLGGFAIPGVEGVAGRGGVGIGVGTGENAGTGGAGDGFGSRGTGHRKEILGRIGGTRASERAVGAALNWIARHQNPAGNWSLQHNRHCTGRGCSCPGWVKADAGATGLALLPFLAAGQTQKDKGPYKEHVNKGIAWLMKHQKADGDLASDAQQPMYSHGIATLALCEDYGMTKDEYVGSAARKAIRYIELAQNTKTGGWRYLPGDTGDTSVVGWQMMALKSAQLAGLGIDSQVFENTRRWIKSVAKGEHGGLFSYQPYREITPAMTAVGLLCSQYLGDRADTPAMLQGKDYLLGNLPDDSLMRNSYYWYYATMAMHNFMGPEWDKWNRQMRRVLILSQEKEGCATGSWDPENPAADAWGGQGGRLTITCLCTLTLEVYYRYLPLYQMQSPAKNDGIAAQK